MHCLNFPLKCNLYSPPSQQFNSWLNSSQLTVSAIGKTLSIISTSNLRVV